MTAMHLDFSYRELEKISGINKFTNAKTLYLCNNKIKKISGLNKLVNLKELFLIKNHITKIEGLNNLVNLELLSLSENIIYEIEGLDNLVALHSLFISMNRHIKEIKGLDSLINLRHLNLYYNQISEIKNLDNLINLRNLDLSSNKITEIKGLDHLVSLQYLNLSNNEITKIKGLDNLINLRELNLFGNNITELPLSLCNLRNLTIFHYHGNPLEYIPLPVQRWLDRMNRRVTDTNMVYNDKQNIHNHHIQNSFRNSLENILRDNNLLTHDVVKTEILNNDVLTEQTKREILNYCDDKSEHTTYLITYADLLVYVWSRISKSENKSDLCKVLNQEISDGLCMCFTGRITRLLNCLTGFYDDIELQISDSEQITNIIVSLKKKYDGIYLYDHVRAELIDRQYSNEVINEWLEYL